MKVVINSCWGGFGISEEAAKLLMNEGDAERFEYDYSMRANSALVKLIEEKGSEFVSGFCAKLVIVEIPDDTTDYIINDYDGMESVIYVVDGKIRRA